MAISSDWLNAWANEPFVLAETPLDDHPNFKERYPPWKPPSFTESPRRKMH